MLAPTFSGRWSLSLRRLVRRGSPRVADEAPRTVRLGRLTFLYACTSLACTSLVCVSLLFASCFALATTATAATTAKPAGTAKATRPVTVLADTGGDPGLEYIKCMPPPTPSDAYQGLVRDCFFKMLRAGNDIYARRILNGYENRYGGWNPTLAERKFWNGDFAGSYAEYVYQDAIYPRDPDHQDEHKLDPHLSAALDRLRHNDVAGALREQAGDKDQGSLYLLMYGNLYAQERDWGNAYAKWGAAAAEGPDGYIPAAGGIGIVPDQWNMAALEMIYYYRKHDPLYGHPQ